MNILTRSLATGFLALAAGNALAQDAPRVLTIASWAGPNHVVNAGMWPAFIERLEDISGGQVTAEVVLNLVPPPAMADLVLDGGADITFIFHGYNAGRFVAPQLVELPGVPGGAEAASGAYWRVWEDYLEAAGEQEEFKTLAMFMHGPAQFHLVNPISGLADIARLKIRAPGGVGSLVIDALGAVGIQVPATRVYETLSSGAADGVTMNPDGRISFNLDEVAPVMFEIPGGFYRGSFAVLMSRETWESLSPDLQTALDRQLFGEELSRLFGRIWDEGDRAAIERSQTLGNPIIAASEADIALFAPIVAQAEAAVLQQVNERGIDAAAARAAFVAHTAEITAELGS